MAVPGAGGGTPERRKRPGGEGRAAGRRPRPLSLLLVERPLVDHSRSLASEHPTELPPARGGGLAMRPSQLKESLSRESPAPQAKTKTPDKNNRVNQLDSVRIPCEASPDRCRVAFLRPWCPASARADPPANRAPRQVPHSADFVDRACLRNGRLRPPSRVLGPGLGWWWGPFFETWLRRGWWWNHFPYSVAVAAASPALTKAKPVLSYCLVVGGKEGLLFRVQAAPFILKAFVAPPLGAPGRRNRPLGPPGGPAGVRRLRGPVVGRGPQRWR